MPFLLAGQQLFTKLFNSRPSYQKETNSIDLPSHLMFNIVQGINIESIVYFFVCVAVHDDVTFVQ